MMSTASDMALLAAALPPVTVVYRQVRHCRHTFSNTLALSLHEGNPVRDASRDHAYLETSRNTMTLQLFLML